MQNTLFVSKLQDVLKNYNTIYGMGMYGWPITETNIQRKVNSNSRWWQVESNVTKVKKVINKDYFGFDCICFIKAVALWGWTGDSNDRNGGAKYSSKYDKSANETIKICTDVSADFTNILLGELLWMDGHVGIYIGNNLTIECTPVWQNGVQITSLTKREGYHSRTWTKHGKLPYIEYPKEETLYKVGQEYILTGYLYGDSKGNKRGKYLNNLKVTITKINKGSPMPYNVNNGLGWVKESDLKSINDNINYYPKCDIKYYSLVDALKSVNVNSSYTNRKKIALKNGISNYTGTKSQNIKLLDLLKKGQLVKI